MYTSSRLADEGSEDVDSEDDDCAAADTVRRPRLLVFKCGCLRAKDRTRSRLPFPGTLMTGSLYPTLSPAFPSSFFTIGLAPNWTNFFFIDR